MTLQRPAPIRNATLSCAASLILALACLAGCDRPQVVKPPVDNPISVTSVPPRPREEVKTPDVEAVRPRPTPPPIRVVTPSDVQRVVAELAGDSLTRVWVKGAQVDVVLSHTLVTDDDLTKLAGIAGLRSLNLDECREITSAGLAHMALLKDLRKLSLSRTAIGDAGLAHLAAAPGLTDLSLTGVADVTDAGMPHLARCASLQVLRLKETRMGDSGLTELHALSALREVWLEGTRVTEQGMAALEQARPGMRIVYPGRRKGK